MYREKLFDVYKFSYHDQRNYFLEGLSHKWFICTPSKLICLFRYKVILRSKNMSLCTWHICKTWKLVILLSIRYLIKYHHVTLRSTLRNYKLLDLSGFLRFFDLKQQSLRKSFYNPMNHIMMVSISIEYFITEAFTIFHITQVSWEITCLVFYTVSVFLVHPSTCFYLWASPIVYIEWRLLS